MTRTIARAAAALTGTVVMSLAASCTTPATPTGSGSTTAPSLATPIQRPELAAVPTVPLASASDEFDGASPTGVWGVFLGDTPIDSTSRYDVGKTVPGALSVLPGRASWVNGSRAFYLYRQVSGDFMVTVRAKAAGRATPLPTVDWSLCGLLLRAPQGQPENWIGYTVGYVGGPVIERKTTMSGRSVLRLTPIPAGWIELRAVRVGPLFALLYRVPEQNWVVHTAYFRPELPDDLQVGIDAGTGFESDLADLVATIDWIRFRPTGIPTSARETILATITTKGSVEDGYAASTANLATITSVIGDYLTS